MDRGCKILPVGMEEEERVIAFLNANFLKDEPLNHSVGVSSEFKPPFDMLKSGLCLKMESETGDMIGVALNAENDLPHDNVSLENGRDCTIPESHGPEFEPILRFLKYVDEQCPVKATEGAMHVHILAVDAMHRNAGVGRRLVEASVQLAKEKQMKGVVVSCSSHYTSRMFDKMSDFKKVLTVPYASYLDPSGKPVFSPPSPHVEAVVYFMRL